jgi:hypothetical protein
MARRSLKQHPDKMADEFLKTAKTNTSEVTIPRTFDEIFKTMTAKIISLYNEGVSINKISLVTNKTPEHIRNVINDRTEGILFGHKAESYYENEMDYVDYNDNSRFTRKPQQKIIFKRHFAELKSQPAGR